MAALLFALFSCCYFVVATGSAHAQIVLPGSGVINTVAGNGSNGFSGDGGAATSAELDVPIGVAVDNAGNIYIADTSNNRIRKVTASTGDISTVAGNGTAGFSGDGGAATSAKLSGPDGVAVDSTGNIYIADTNNNRIRKVTASTGNISTIAGNGTSGFTGDGGAATSAELTAPVFLAVDTAGNIYITDTSNTRVREVTASTGIISTVAGQSGTTVCGGATNRFGDGCAATNAVLDSPEGITVDSSGNLYIADSGACEVREVTASTSTIFAVAGNPTCGFSGDGGSPTIAELHGPFGVVLDAGGNIYIADTGNERIRKVTLATGRISTVAGNGTLGFSGDGGTATSAELYSPESVAIDATGNLYLADPTDNRIRAVGSSTGPIVILGTGIIDTLAGDGTGGFSGDSGTATSAELNHPDSVTVDSSGNLYIADTNNNRIRKVTASTGKITTYAGNGTAGFSGDGGAATSAELNSPSGVVLDSSGNLYIADTNNNRIRKITASTGVISTVAGNGTAGFSGDGAAATSAELNGSFGVALDTSGNIYIADTNNQRIRKVTISTGNISTVAGNGTAGYIMSLPLPATSTELNNPHGVAVDSSGNIFIADTSNNMIRVVIASTGFLDRVAGNFSANAGFGGDGGMAFTAALDAPDGVSLDSTGNIYIADTTNERIRKVTGYTGFRTGTISTIAGNGAAAYFGDGGAATSAELNNPNGVTVDSSGNIYIADTNNNRIRAIGH